MPFLFEPWTVISIKVIREGKQNLFRVNLDKAGKIKHWDMRYRLYNLHDFRFLLTQFFGTAVTVNYNTMTVVNGLTIYTFLKCVFENLTWFWTT